MLQKVWISTLKREGNTDSGEEEKVEQRRSAKTLRNLLGRCCRVRLRAAMTSQAVSCEESGTRRKEGKKRWKVATVK
jgi:hypothetical protein